ncbi:MAG: UDP-N-acetylglucosamine 1-carboxyvinyltransferase [Planctomycetes bacterium]|nr:UDP-N-acetylglucosamine 1-carboxyvinyltransferase [Planctomycetota bacterium]
MDAFVIQGGRRLKGTVRVSGAKNAALPLMAAALLAEGPCVLHGVPHLSDIDNMANLLRELGCTVEHAENGTMKLEVVDELNSHARYEVVRTMRASVCVLGPLLGKRHNALISMPGGCAIGDRPIDIHLRGLRQLNVDIDLEEGGNVHAKTRKLRGSKIFLGGPFGSTVLGTINVMCAASLADGTTVIESAACEPEVVDVADFLNAMGAHISGAGTPRMTIEGVKTLRGTEHRVIADRIEAGTLLMTAAITNGDVKVENCPIDALGAAVDCLANIGVGVDVVDKNADLMRATVAVSSARRLEPVMVTTQPHPGFPTDLQAQLMALLTLADGNSIITEKIYPERFLHVAELARMGANLYRQGPTVMVSGVKRLIGAPVMASDLRASAGLVMAGLAAKGTTKVNRVYHLDRGYEQLDRKLQALGAEIERVKE